MREKLRENPGLKGLVMGQHGLINWADDDKTCYELTLSLIEKAARYLGERDLGDKAFGGQKGKPLAQAERDALLHEVLPSPARDGVAGEKVHRHPRGAP